MLNFKEAFGMNLKLIRKSQKLTQEALSEMLEINPRQMSKIETGEHFPSAKTLEKICLKLNVEPSELFNFNFENSAQSSSLKNKEVTLLINNLKKIVKHKDYIDYFKAAIDALDSKEDLEKFELIIKGMKISRWSKK